MNTVAAIDREWRRFTPVQRLARFALYFGIVFACVISLRTVQVIPRDEDAMSMGSRKWLMT